MCWAQGNKSPVGTPNQAWLSLDLLSTLSFLYEAGHGAAVRELLELPLTQCPEVLVLGFASARRCVSFHASDQARGVKGGGLGSCAFLVPLFLAADQIVGVCATLCSCESCFAAQCSLYQSGN